MIDRDNKRSNFMKGELHVAANFLKEEKFMIFLGEMSQKETRKLCCRENVSCIGTIGELEAGKLYDRIQAIRFKKGETTYCGFYHIMWDRFVDPSEVANVRVSGSYSYVDGAWVSSSATNLVRTKGSECDHKNCLAALKAAATWERK